MNIQEHTMKIKQNNITDTAKTPGQNVLLLLLLPKYQDPEFSIYRSPKICIFLPYMYILINISFGLLILVLNKHSIMWHVFYLTCFYAWGPSMLIHEVVHFSGMFGIPMKKDAMI